MFLVCNAVDLQTWSHALASVSVQQRDNRLARLLCASWTQRAFACIVRLLSSGSHHDPGLADHNTHYITVSLDSISENPKFKKVKWLTQGHRVSDRDKIKMHVFWGLPVPCCFQVCGQPWGSIPPGKEIKQVLSHWDRFSVCCLSLWCNRPLALNVLYLPYKQLDWIN